MYLHPAFGLLGCIHTHTEDPMSNRLTCTACNQPIPNGEAVLTSRLFEQRAWHPEHAPDRQTVPEQRTGAHDDLALAVRR